MLYYKPLASCRSPSALKRPDRSKKCHCLQFAKCIASLLHYYKLLLPSHEFRTIDRKKHICFLFFDKTVNQALKYKSNSIFLRHKLLR